MNYQTKNILSALTGVICLFSCESYLDLDAPNNRLPTSAVFSDSTAASLAIIGIYSDMMSGNGGFVASQVRWAGLCADELIFTGTRDVWEEFMKNNLQEDNTELNFMWNNTYRHLYQTNSVIEGVEEAAGITATARDALIAEARFIRAFLLFYMVNNWGDIPLAVGTDYRENESMERTPVAKVYGQIVDDLTEASSKLPVNYPTPERVRPNRATALALLARVHLYNGSWEHAIATSTDVIGFTANYQLANLENCFLKESPETIWQLYSVARGNDTYDGFYFIPLSLTNATIPSFIVADELLQSFEPGDQRPQKWIGIKPVGPTAPYFFPFKYKQRAMANREHTVTLRLAEQYLIRAEAYARAERLTDAIDDLNVIRDRAGIGALTYNLSKEEVLEKVEEERRHELFCEWGHRWFDLKRTGRADGVLRPIKGEDWQATDVLWPLPITQRLANPRLYQNDGY